MRGRAVEILLLLVIYRRSDRTSVTTVSVGPNPGLIVPFAKFLLTGGRNNVLSKHL